MGLSPILSVIQPVTTDTMLNNNGRITKDMFSQASVILSLNGVHYHVKGQPPPSPRQGERSPLTRVKGQPLPPGQGQRSTTYPWPGSKVNPFSPQPGSKVNHLVNPGQPPPLDNTPPPSHHRNYGQYAGSMHPTGMHTCYMTDLTLKWMAMWVWIML